METKEKQIYNCIAWFLNRGIKAHTDGESVKILVEDYWVFISNSEIEYRSELFIEETNP